MKRLIFTLLLTFPVFAFAQFYTFSVKQEPYQKLVNALHTPPGVLRGGAIASMQVKIPFYMFGYQIDTLTMYSTGFMVLKNTSNDNIMGVSPCVAQTSERYPDWPNLYASSMGIKVDTVNNKRIMKLEYNNIGFVYGSNPDTTNFFNAQAWFYEDSNIIEFHYGPSLTDAATWFQTYSGPYVSIDSAENASVYNLSGSPSSPVISGNNNLNLNAFPANGTVYRFAPIANIHTGIREQNTPLAFSVYPNPAKENITVTLEKPSGSKPKLILMDIQGREIKSVDMTSGELSVQLPVNDIPPGLYFVKVETATRSAMSKVLIH